MTRLVRLSFAVAASALLAGCALSKIEDCDGQDEDWVRLSFPKEKAEEILKVGYAKWVDDTVGYGLQNGYFKFVVVLPEGIVFPTQIYVNGQSVCARRPGEYVFLAEKGVQFNFNCTPFDSRIKYLVTDDMAIPPYDPSQPKWAR